MDKDEVLADEEVQGDLLRAEAAADARGTLVEEDTSVASELEHPVQLNGVIHVARIRDGRTQVQAAHGTNTGRARGYLEETARAYISEQHPLLDIISSQSLIFSSVAVVPNSEDRLLDILKRLSQESLPFDS
ncbi:hypothetical protein CBL_13945 [Carabus blaptoides fortunei]